MRPDKRRRHVPPIGRTGSQPVPFDAASDPDAAELAELERELATAGARARAGRLASGHDRLDPSFAAALLAQLMDGYAVDTTSEEPAARRRTLPRPAWSRPVVRLPARRWAVLAVAAAVVVAVLGSTSGQLFPASFDARATEAVGATLVRDGAVTALIDGTALRTNDEIRVGTSGRVTLALGASLTRLDAGADVRLDDLSPDRLRIELLAGRTYHRVSLPNGGTYVVATGPVAWEALGTAFDIDREPSPDGHDRVSLLGLEHAIGLVGPDLRTTVGEGQAATLILGEAAPSDLDVGPIDPARLDDPWLVDNARRDRALGFPLGVLDRFGLGPTPSPAEALGPSGAEPAVAAPTDAPAATPGPNASTSPEPATRSEPKPTSKPAPEATPKPSPRPLPALRLGLISCDGGIVVDWSRYKGARFNHYATIRSTTASIPKAYPPHGGARDLEGASTTVRWKTSAFDAGGDVGARYFYRTMAFDAADRVIATSPVRSATARKVRELGGLSVGPGDGTKTAFSWNPYEGPGDCFTWYKVVYSRDDSTPSVLEGASVAVAVSNRRASEALARLEPGTYHFRLEVLRYVELGSPPKFIVAHSSVATYTVP